MGSSSSVDEEKWIKHYSSRHQILLVGEGDFSFAACLATAFGNASNIIATSLDSRELLREKYPTTADQNLVLLRDKGCTVLHEVDASSMSQHPFLKYRQFDRIVFNFPHAGFMSTYCKEHSPFQISLHQGVVRGFLRNAYEMVAERGEVHITHKTAYPFSKWEIEELGQEAGLRLTERAFFYIHEYPGYINRKGAGHLCNESFPVGECMTFKFAK